MLKHRYPRLLLMHFFNRQAREILTQVQYCTENQTTNLKYHHLKLPTSTKLSVCTIVVEHFTETVQLSAAQNYAVL